MTDDYTKNYIKYDGLTPFPSSGPRVLVGYWAIDGVPEGTKPEVPDEPLYTIMYPVGNGEQPFNWQHCQNYQDEQVTPNSAKNIQWLDGHLQIDQFTDFGGRPSLYRDLSDQPNTKGIHWVLFRDVPDYLFGKIQRTYEILDVQIREECQLQFRAADGHYIGINDREEVICAKRVPNELCTFTARFPNFTWDEEGGEYDEGAFYLQANNKKYLSKKTIGGKTRLYADANREDAELFDAVFSSGVVSLRSSTGLVLCHEPPYSELELQDDLPDDSAWVWFNVSYI